MKLKSLHGAPLLAACALFSPLAMATSTELQLNGQIFAGACDIMVANNGVYDYGDIPNANLVSGVMTDLGRNTQNFEITCAAPMRVAFKMTDNREGTEFSGSIAGGPGPDTAKLGLNLDPVGEPIGFSSYRITSQPIVNSAEGRLLRADFGGGNWVHNWTNEWLPLERLYSFSEGDGTSPAAISSVSVPLQSGVFVAPRETLDLSRGLDLDGSVTVELIYL